MKILTILITTALLELCPYLPAVAGEGDIGPVYIAGVATIARPFSAHKAGNMEITIQNGFTLPPGVTCDSAYITTLKGDDSDKRLFTLATLAQVTKSPIFFRISDDPSHEAYPGRCSLVSAGIAQ